MPNVGDSIDRYVIEAVIGEGGMGRVYRATDPRLGRRVAITVLLAEGDERVRRSLPLQVLVLARDRFPGAWRDVKDEVSAGERVG